MSGRSRRGRGGGAKAVNHQSKKQTTKDYVLGVHDRHHGLAGLGALPRGFEARTVEGQAAVAAEAVAKRLQQRRSAREFDPVNRTWIHEQLGTDLENEHVWQLLEKKDHIVVESGRYFAVSENFSSVIESIVEALEHRDNVGMPPASAQELKTLVTGSLAVATDLNERDWAYLWRKLAKRETVLHDARKGVYSYRPWKLLADKEKKKRQLPPEVTTLIDKVTRYLHSRFNDYVLSIKADPGETPSPEALHEQCCCRKEEIEGHLHVLHVENIVLQKAKQVAGLTQVHSLTQLDRVRKDKNEPPNTLSKYERLRTELSKLGSIDPSLFEVRVKSAAEVATFYSIQKQAVLTLAAKATDRRRVDELTDDMHASELERLKIDLHLTYGYEVPDSLLHVPNAKEVAMALQDHVPPPEIPGPVATKLWRALEESPWVRVKGGGDAVDADVGVDADRDAPRTYSLKFLVNGEEVVVRHAKEVLAVVRRFPDGCLENAFYGGRVPGGEVYRGACARVCASLCLVSVMSGRVRQLMLLVCRY